MSTRGAIGFRVDGKDKVAYNHCDSYPSYLGKEVVNFIQEHSNSDLRFAARRIELIDESISPTEEQIKVCKDLGLLNLGVSTRSEKDWYCLLREAQGGLRSYMGDNACPFMPDSSDFLMDSLFCEYAYIINLDDNILEFYVGGANPASKGRYAKDGGVPLVKEWSLCDVRNGYENANSLVEEMKMDKVS